MMKKEKNIIREVAKNKRKRKISRLDQALKLPVAAVSTDPFFPLTARIEGGTGGTAPPPAKALNSPSFV